MTVAGLRSGPAADLPDRSAEPPHDVRPVAVVTANRCGGWPMPTVIARLNGELRWVVALCAFGGCTHRHRELGVRMPGCRARRLPAPGGEAVVSEFEARSGRRARRRGGARAIRGPAGALPAADDPRRRLTKGPGRRV
jgi:hypothetical protein